VATLLSLVENCNWVSSGSTTIGARDSTVIAGKSGLACELAAENAAMERTAPARAGSRVRSKVEV
jgi:hypothetical protein